MGQLIQIHETISAKTKGVFAAVNIAARRMGIGNNEAIRVAKSAEEMVEKGHSPAWAVSYQKALAKRLAKVRLA